MAGNDLVIKQAIVNIKVFGVGGGGNSVLLRMAKDNALGIELIAVNTDAKQLAIMEKAGIVPLQIGDALTKGRGTGGSQELGESAAQADAEKLRAAMKGANLIFVTAGMGGGAGTGAAPVVASLAKELGILTVGVVTMPFSFEGARKRRLAEAGVIRMQTNMDALIAVHNDNLMKLETGRQMSLVQAFEAADGILRQAISCISEMILTTGVVNVDFADVTSVFRQSESSDALLGIGESEDGAVKAVQQAVESPLVEKSLAGARGIILNLTGGEGLSLYEVNEATKYIYENTDPEVNIIFGTVIDKSFGDRVRATVIATDFADSIVLKTPHQVLAKKGIGNFSIDAPDFMTKPMSKVPQFKPAGSFEVPTFHTNKDENKEKDKEK